MIQSKRIIWIDWGRHLRSQTLSRRLEIELFEICINDSRFKRYIKSALKTICIFRNERPGVIIATNPSIVLGFLLILLRLWYRFCLVSDAHYFGVKASNGSQVLQSLLNFYNTKVNLVIVTNASQAQALSKLGARTYICQDPLPQIQFRPEEIVLLPLKSVFFICSFDTDEPYEAAFSAFGRLQEKNFILFVSGNYRKARTDLSRFPWVRFLGFLSDDQYYAYLRACSVVMDLTTSEDCLVCGAYEALSVRKPLVISKTKALSDYFGNAVVLTDNTPDAICESILLAFEQRDKLSQLAKDWVITNNHYMDESISSLRTLLQSLDR